MKNNNNLNEIVVKLRKKNDGSNKRLIYNFLLIGFEMVVWVVLGLAIGRIIDYYLNTSPAFTMALIIIGFLSGFRRILK